MFSIGLRCDGLRADSRVKARIFSPWTGEGRERSGRQWSRRNSDSNVTSVVYKYYYYYKAMCRWLSSLATQHSDKPRSSVLAATVDAHMTVIVLIVMIIIIHSHIVWCYSQPWYYLFFRRPIIIRWIIDYVLPQLNISSVCAHVNYSFECTDHMYDQTPNTFDVLFHRGLILV